jgi:hypothetical protein
MSIAEELTALRGDDGKINVHTAVDWARKHRSSRLHAALEWDNEQAGEAYRRWQVRNLIAVHIVDASGGRRYVSLSIDRREGGYRPIEDILPRVDLRECMLNDALAELNRLQKKYERLKELDEVWAARDRVAGRRRRTAAAVTTEAAA